MTARTISPDDGTWQSRFAARSLVVLSALLALPFYVVLTDQGWTFAPLLGFDRKLTLASVGIPLGMIGIALIALALAAEVVRGRRIWNDTPSRLALALLIWMTAVAVYGMSISDRPLLTASYLVQSALPLIVFLAVRHVSLSAADIRRALGVFAVMAALSVVLIEGLALLKLRSYAPINAWSHVQESFYGAKNIHPAVIAVALAITLAGLSTARTPRDRAIAWIILGILSTFLLVIWSRSGLALMAGLAAVWCISMAIAKFRGHPVNVSNIQIAGIAAVFAAATAFNLLGGGVSLRSTPGDQKAAIEAATKPQPPRKFKNPNYKPTVRRIPKISTEEELRAIRERGDERRRELFYGALHRIAASPIVGDAFNVVSADALPGDVKAHGSKLYPSHNQFADLAIRAGLPSLGLFLALCASLLHGLWTRRGPTVPGNLAQNAILLLVLVLAASMTQLYFIVTQSAASLFMVFALALRAEPHSGPGSASGPV